MRMLLAGGLLTRGRDAWETEPNGNLHSVAGAWEYTGRKTLDPKPSSRSSQQVMKPRLRSRRRHQTALRTE